MASGLDASSLHPAGEVPHACHLLQLAAFDAIAAEYGMHPEGGVPRENVEREIAAHAARIVQDQSLDDHMFVASWLVDRLLNVGHAARGFDVPWIDPANDYRRDDLRVIALYETLTSEGEVRLHADEAALNLALAGLDLDLEDRQIAAEAVLRAQIESGRWSQAEQSAAITRRIAVEYRNRLDRFLRSVERDLRDINWESEVETILEESLAHIETRVNVLHQLSDHATQLAEDVDPTSRTQAAAVVDLVGDTLHQLLALQQHILEARSRFRAAQVTQGFAISLAVGKVQLRDDVFQPMLTKVIERARTQLLYGEYLRRPRRKSDARSVLAAALEAFSRAGALTWADRARVELRAAAQADGGESGALSGLTAQQRRIVEAIGQGASNREVAARLFLSPRTVDYHLRNVYIKLGFKSRSELIRDALTARSALTHG